MTPESGQLRYKAPKGVMTTELIHEIKEHKPVLLETLRFSSTPKAVLSKSKYGCLTKGGLRDALVIQTGCRRAEAEFAIDLAIEIGNIIGPDDDGLYYAKFH
jgi:hypothetical protein